MLSNLESNYGIAFGGSDDSDSSSESDSSSSSYKPDRNTPVGAINRGPDRTATEARIENNPGREWNPTEDCSEVIVETVAAAVVAVASKPKKDPTNKQPTNKREHVASGGLATLAAYGVEDIIDECTTPIVPGMPTVPRQ